MDNEVTATSLLDLVVKRLPEYANDRYDFYLCDSEYRDFLSCAAKIVFTFWNTVKILPCFDDPIEIEVIGSLREKERNNLGEDRKLFSFLVFDGMPCSESDCSNEDGLD